jgi:hypothetical protein
MSFSSGASRMAFWFPASCMSGSFRTGMISVKGQHALDRQRFEPVRLLMSFLMPMSSYIWGGFVLRCLQPNGGLRKVQGGRNDAIHRLLPTEYSDAAGKQWYASTVRSQLEAKYVY